MFLKLSPTDQSHIVGPYEFSQRFRIDKRIRLRILDNGGMLLKRIAPILPSLPLFGWAVLVWTLLV